MTTKLLARLSLAASLALAATASLNAAEFYYQQTTSTYTYSTFIGPTPIGNLVLTLPAASKDFNAALVTLNVPNITLSNPDPAGSALSAVFEIVAPTPSEFLEATATVGCDTCKSLPANQGVTLVMMVPLGTDTQLVSSEFSTTGNCTATVSAFASISAILVKQ